MIWTIDNLHGLSAVVLRIPPPRAKQHAQRARPGRDDLPGHHNFSCGEEYGRF